MNRILHIILLWLLIALPAGAEVLIYKGTGVTYTATQYSSSAGEGCYLIVDLEANEMTVIIYGLLDRKRRQETLIDKQTLDLAPVTGLANRTYYVFANEVRQNPTPGEFSDQAAFFRGLSTNLNVSGSPGHYGVQLYPRALAGIYRYLGAGFGSDYREDNFALGYDQADTLNANNQSADIATAEATIIAKLTTAGYMQ